MDRRTRLLYAGAGLAALSAAVARLPFVDGVASHDEAGFLVLARQWKPGSSLYGDYWVDRPPLLLLPYRLADSLAGVVFPVTALRLFACAVVIVTVLLTAATARRVAGPRAVLPAALVAAVLLANPRSGAQVVDGELLAAPLVALGVWAWTGALRAHPVRRGLLAGAAAACAVLVKQNMIDVGVYAVVLLLLLVLRRPDLRADLRTVAGRAVPAAAAGASVALAVVLGYAVHAGTDLGALYDAMFPFRVEAHAAAARMSVANGRPGELVRVAVLCGLLPVLAWVALVLRRRLLEPAPMALVVVLVWDLVSVIAGGGYWTHYLVQAVVPLSVLAGVAGAAASERRPVTRVACALAAVVLVGSVVPGLAYAVRHPIHSPEMRVGRSIAAVAAPGDTVVSLYGSPEVLLGTGLESPYPYLWILPLRVKDPDLADLSAILGGDDAPTWVVVTNEPGRMDPVLRARYRDLGDICGVDVRLLASVTRPTPTCVRPRGS
ncbi:glycosyltransferase family 39 protein [Nocardioides jiangxiensis]|uniref:Glycosyltransferase family 39 protein n=1 Tax=Nocardioides jiangxiensis TaxID=3064524 RepID=A0ABT9AWJ3_9ACTN|nr:glycosyltransferase family 39 protein [Nocardioides sp. WY-20]MDO7866809.1 glycosyltransferase family 39 protein [Nocardioides sp. WY-20]